MQVFISHSHSDSPLAARVSRALRKAGLQVWDPEVHLLPGDNWPAQVGRRSRRVRRHGRSLDAPLDQFAARQG